MVTDQLAIISTAISKLYLVKRGPNKRRIKPAENNDLLQLALCYEDGSEDDDEDFEMDSDDDNEGLNYTYLVNIYTV